MDPSREQHHQEMAAHQTLESMLVCTKAQQEKKARPLEQALKCPRCDSTNTKFCYYNNYSLTQPRYFCKSCRRYWTKGGTLRNVPVGGGCRKNKRLSSSSASSKRGPDQAMIPSANNPSLSGLSSSYDSEISLAIARLQKQNFGQLGGFDELDLSILGNNNPNNNTTNNLPHSDHGLFDAMRTGFLEAPPNVYQHLYYNGNLGILENGGLSLGINDGEEMASMPYDHPDMGSGANAIATTTTTTTTPSTAKQQMCNPREGETRMLMGFPWQFGGEGNMVGFEPPPRQNWNGFGSSSLHGLLNSPLM